MRRLSSLKIIIILITVAIALLQLKAGAQNTKTISLSDELRQLYDITLLPAYRESSIVAQTSTYDKTGGNNDGFAGTYSYLRRNADSSLVMFDVAGTGVINRIATPTPTDDILDFYIDDTTKPAYSIKYSDLFSGKVLPFMQPLCGNQLGGFYCYYPIMFNKSCRIVSRGKHLQFHQIQYRLYAKGTGAKSFSPNLNDEEKAALQKIVSFWKAPVDEYKTGTQVIKVNTDIKPGETKTIATLNEGGRIMGIEFDDAAAYAGLNKNIDIKITWDGEAAPAVDCPLADFFGYAFGEPSMQSLLAGSKNNRNYCYYPMPFDKKATVELTYRNDGTHDVNKHIQANIYYAKNKRDIQKEGKFYAAWQGNAKPAEGAPHVFLNTKGKGHYVATILQAQGLQPGMTYFFEGDDSTAVDGEPRIHGTGSEDYFNGGWYALPARWDGKFSLPMYGCLDYSLPFCRTGGYRLYLADKVSFEKSIFQSMEHGPEGNKVPVSYTSLSFYYSSTPPATIAAPTNELTKVFMPDTLMVYPQLMNFNMEGEINTKTQWAYNTGGESFSFTVNDESVLSAQLDKIPGGHYKLLIDFVKSPQGCDFSVWQRQTKISDFIPGNSASKERIDQLYVGDVTIDDFNNSLGFQFKTTTTNNNFYLNRLILVRQP